MDKNKKKIAKPKPRAKKIKKEENNYFSSFNFAFDLIRVFLIFSVLIFLVVSFVFARMQAGNFNTSKEFNSLSSFNDFKVIELGEKAFGSLNVQGYLEDSPISRSSNSQGLYGAGTSGPESVDFVDDSMIVMPSPILYNYIYTGDDFDTFMQEELVYRRVKPSTSEAPATSFIGSSIPFVDLGGVSDLKMSSFNLTQDVEFGYNFNFSLEEGYFSLYKNWKRWPNVEKICGSWDNFYCFEEYRLSESDILSDSELLKISGDFLRKYSINLENFGQGEVQNQWLSYYSRAENKASYYIPESINVIYPLKINNRTVYEEYGNVSGLSVEVDIREKKVSGLYNLYNQQYEGSYYQTETDKTSIIEMAEKGGNYYSYYNEDESFEFVDVEIGTPKLEIVKIWTYDDISREGYELYVPAYIFPINKNSLNLDIYQENIVIPAVKDFFNRYDYLISPRVLPAMDIEITR
ncbi:MAG: hypothetical protein WCZ12_03185 [Patescibacteria group bacterium]